MFKKILASVMAVTMMFGLSVLPAVNDMSETAVKASAEDSDKKTWRTAYADLLTKSSIIKNVDHFSLCYVNDDDIPELVLQWNEGLGTHVNTNVYIYSYYDGEIIRRYDEKSRQDISSANGGFNTFTYNERGNEFIAGAPVYMGSGSSNIIGIVDGKFEILHTKKSILHDPSTWYYTYEIDGVPCSTLEEFNAKWEALLEGGNWKGKSNGDYEITEENIKKYILEGDSDTSKPDTKPTATTLGNINGDDSIDVSDVSALINSINGVKPLTDEQKNVADVNGDGTVDVADAAAIINHINGLKSLF